jgi:hypothetical protein
MTNQGEISEEDICTQYILPALVRSGWDVSKQVREQVYFTDGRIYVKGNQTRRGKAKKAESCDFTHISTSWIIKCYLYCVQDEIIRFAPATAQKNIYVKIITSLLFPSLPPHKKRWLKNAIARWKQSTNSNHKSNTANNSQKTSWEPSRAKPLQNLNYLLICSRSERLY